MSLILKKWTRLPWLYISLAVTISQKSYLCSCLYYLVLIHFSTSSNCAFVPITHQWPNLATTIPILYVHLLWPLSSIWYGYCSSLSKLPLYHITILNFPPTPLLILLGRTLFFHQILNVEDTWSFVIHSLILSIYIL